MIDSVMVSKRKFSYLNKQAVEWEHLVQVTSRPPVRRRLFADEATRKVRSARIKGYVRNLLEKDAIEKQRRFGFKFSYLSKDDPSSPWEWQPLKQYSSSPVCASERSSSKPPLPRLENYFLDHSTVDNESQNTKSSDCERSVTSSEVDCTKPLQKLEYCPFCLSSTSPVRSISL
ncbi:hypothetical protein M514_07478 [Trichuris suis]|uniref:Uncharacterized protein n=1 Tax=Trichuris suis TaxID=68888 RepID=A0A085NE42_9BILA|nr:hypothetical protein M513_07478 [Trichuris suis]KFD67738.1 hypothetical protein M514_07478 [Trichuris suis]KHJ41264.1 hypothetical protein D918_08716 [Trichuris suis]